MTILTKPSTGAKSNPKVLDAAHVETGAVIEQDENGNNDKLFLLNERRRFTGSTLLLVLASLCLACMGILIGLVIYRRVQLQRAHFHGMCNLPYDGNFEENREILSALNKNYQTADMFSGDSLQELLEQSKRDFFREEFDIDLSPENSHSQITVPDFRDGRVGRFIHDFNDNQTAIIDEYAKRCFVLPLDREVILPPKSLADLVLKMYSGYYDINTTSIKKKMRVILPAITDMSTVSQNIQYACDGMSIYRLEEYVGGVVKRSADLTEDGKFAEFSGSYIKYDIINIDQLNNQ